VLRGNVHAGERRQSSYGGAGQSSGKKELAPGRPTKRSSLAVRSFSGATGCACRPQNRFTDTTDRTGVASPINKFHSGNAIRHDDCATNFLDDTGTSTLGGHGTSIESHDLDAYGTGCASGRSLADPRTYPLAVASHLFSANGHRHAACRV
jgi:hypothetical protein